MEDLQILNEIKVLGLETINNAGSGHSGSVMSTTDALYVLYTRHLLSDGTKNILRDRFVLSNGHACAGMYALFAGLNYFDINELKKFRSYKGLLTGHPEIEIPGVDVNTGPLGQGVANAVGLAIAETIMNAKFNLSHYTYCMVGDGCLQEGVGLEALSVAGLYKLNKFILFYDKNDVTLDGKLSASCNDNIALKFKSMNFNVIEVDGHNLEKIDKAIIKAKASKSKPTVIILNTIIGKDTNLAGSNLSHGKVYSEEDILALRKKYKLTSEKLNLSNEAKEILLEKKNLILQKFNEKIEKFNENLEKNKEIKKNFNKFIKNDFKFKVSKNNQINQGRQLNNIVLNDICKTVDNIVTLSADLSSSTKVRINDGGNYSHLNRMGKNIAVGIREHAMGAIANGIALHGGLRVITSTFLTFANYMMPAIRMASIMKLPVMFTFSHGSVFDSSDGTTHIPVEQLDQLRLIPNTLVLRPSDINECKACYNFWYEYNMPICLSLARSNVPYIGEFENVNKGAYFVTDNKGEINIMASGSEVELALKVKADLELRKVNANVISVLSLEIFEKQNASYKKSILNKPIFVIESSTAVKFLKYTTEDKIFNVRDFGITADSKTMKTHYGLTVENISKQILKSLKKN